MKKIRQLLLCSMAFLLIACSGKQTGESQKTNPNISPMQLLTEAATKMDTASWQQEIDANTVQIDTDGGKLNARKSHEKAVSATMRYNDAVYTKRTFEGGIHLYEMTTKTSIASIYHSADGKINQISFDDMRATNQSYIFNFLVLLDAFLSDNMKDFFTLDASIKDEEQIITIKVKDTDDYKTKNGIALSERSGVSLDDIQIKKLECRITINKKGYIRKIESSQLIDYGNDIVDDSSYIYTYTSINKTIFNVEDIEQLFQKVKQGEIKEGDIIEQF